MLIYCSSSRALFFKRCEITMPKIRLKAQLLALKYVQYHSDITNAAKSIGITVPKAKKILSDPDTQTYIADLQSQIADTISLDQKKQIKKLKKLAKRAKKDADHNVQVRILQEISKMTGLDKPGQKKMKLGDVSDPVAVIAAALKSYSDRDINKEDLDAVMKAMDTLQLFRYGANLEAQLKALQLSSDKPSIFNQKPKVIEGEIIK